MNCSTVSTKGVRTATGRGKIGAERKAGSRRRVHVQGPGCGNDPATLRPRAAVKVKFLFVSCAIHSAHQLEFILCLLSIDYHPLSDVLSYLTVNLLCLKTTMFTHHLSRSYEWYFYSVCSHTNHSFKYVATMYAVFIYFCLLFVLCSFFVIIV